MLFVAFHIQITISLAQTSAINLQPIVTSLDGATSLSVTPSGLIYLTEKNRHRILAVVSSGERTDSLGALGRGDYRFNQPVSVDATNGLKIYVADQNNGRVQLYDRRFQYLSSITGEKIEQGGRFRPSQIQISSSGGLFAYDRDRHIIHVFDPFGNYDRAIDPRRFQIGSDIHMKMSGSELLILDKERGVIHKFTTDGGYLNFIGGFSGAKRIHGTNNSIWGAFNDRVVRFSTLGEPLQIYKFEQRLEPADLHIYQSNVFILLNDQLLTSPLE